MASWEKWLSDYEFVRWSEENFDLDTAPFVRQAYDAGKYAFVSDYVRIYALKTYGGVYLDTDVEVLKPFEGILSEKVVLGTDESGYLTAFMAAEPGQTFFSKLLDLYNGMDFINPDGTQNTEVNNTWMQEVLSSFGYRRENRKQLLADGILIYPSEYFHAKSLTSGKLTITPNTCCIHHHTLLWVSAKTRLIRFLRMKILVPILGDERYTAATEWIKGKKNG